MNDQAWLERELEKPKNDHLRKYLFVAGFLVTDRDVAGLDAFPFCGNWKKTFRQGFWFLTHSRTKVTFFEDREQACTYFLVGHAYDPFTMQYKEEDILAHVAAQSAKGEIRRALDEMTGVYVTGFIRDGAIYFETDASGMQSAACGYFGDTFYLTSHPQLVGDLCCLDMDPLVRELLAYKWYDRVMGPYLPGDMTPYRELRRVVPDIGYTYTEGLIRHKRFYPSQELTPCTDEKAYRQVIAEGADILRRNMELVSLKWAHPAISLTGGIDSNTTFAAANGHYDRFTAFSYLSDPKEKPDVEAAQRIAARFGVPHTLYRIPDTAEEIPDYPVIKEIIDHNNGYIAPGRDNEYRKRAYLCRRLDCDVEVKSWVSETIRAYWYKHYGRTHMPPLSPRLFRNLYKIFLLNRSLAHKVDDVFADYIRSYEYRKIPAGYDISDMHFHEVTWGSWGGMNISEMKIYSDITFIYNNRLFLDLLLHVPLADRISDRHHLDMKALLNRELYDMNSRVVNLHETKQRARRLNLIFTINAHLPF